MIENLYLKLKGKKPVTREELLELIDSWGRLVDFNDLIKKSEIKQCYPLENLDVSKIEDLSYLFCGSNFNGDLSNWDVSNCITMFAMFTFAKFNNDSLKNWDISNVENMNYMFSSSIFNSDISKWNINNCTNMLRTFSYSQFNGDISNWKFNENVNCYLIFENNQSFKDKYNNGSELPSMPKAFMKWVEDNKNRIINLNVSNNEIIELDDYLSNFDEKELINGN